MKSDVSVIATSSLGDRSYVASDGRVAVVVDPQRDVDRVLSQVGRLGVRITHVVETHVHNDYVSGGLQLARLTGASYVLAAADEVAFDRVPVADGDVLVVSDAMRLRAMATPGHTFNHISYVLDEVEASGSWRPVGIFTGGSLLFGTTGRTDLLGAEHADRLAYAQHASSRRLAELVPDGAQVWPTHGFGGFCVVTQSDVPASTVGREKIENPVLRLGADDFVRQTLAELDAYPSYYAHTGGINTSGPAPVDLTPVARVGSADLTEMIDAGQWVVDLRHRRAYAASHLAGTVSLGLDGPMATWVGWLIDRGAPITLLAETADQVADARRELIRIGVDRPNAAATGRPEDWTGDRTRLRSLAVADFAALSAARRPDTRNGLPAPEVILDVRLAHEWRQAHIEDAVHVPLFELHRRLTEVPAGVVWVHCSSGYRSNVAASMLANAGRQVVLVDDRFEEAAPAGIPMVTG